MDILVVLGVLFGAIALGLPIAYSLALAALAGALDRYPDRSGDAANLQRGQQIRVLTIPFFMLAGDHGGRRMARRLVALITRCWFARLRGGLSVVIFCPQPL